LRYYRIVISDPASGTVITPPGFAGLLGGATYTSFVNGQTLPGAWDVELDLPVIDAATSQGFSTVRVWGISLAEIGQARDLIGKNIAVYGGMQKGLPLANPAQSGLLVSGNVFQAFGNWIGLDQTLDFVITPGSATASFAGGIGTLRSPINLTLNWPQGQPLSSALRACLSTAFPGYTINMSISPSIVRPGAEAGYYPTLEQLAQYCRRTSLEVIKDAGYAGVSIVPQGTTISVFDGSVAAGGSAAQINFVDLIGQPTWIESPNISIKTVMRADLAVGKQILLPPTLITNTQQASSNIVNQRVSFQGGFFIVSLRHVGRFRQPTADAWVTVIEASPNKVSGLASID
jgi:hypothetical protein